MDGMMYYGALLLIAFFIFSMVRTNHGGMALIGLVVGVYLVYSHETGHTATEFKNDLVQKIDKEAPVFNHDLDKEEALKRLGN